MARTKKNLTSEERLAQIEEQITQHTETIRMLKEQKRELEKEVKKEKILELYNIVQESGKTLEEVKVLLSK